jgi:amino acid adenylation domain-containing protein
MGESARTLGSGFLRSWDRFPERPALEVDGASLSYRELGRRAASLAATLERHRPGGHPPLTAVFAQRSATAFAGVLAALFRGHGYVPLNPSFPPERNRRMLEHAGCRAVIADRGATAQIGAVLEGIERDMLVLLPDASDGGRLARGRPRDDVVDARGLSSPERWSPSVVDPDSLAYLLFTSGSTGIPKGVMVAHRNATHFVDAMVERYGVSERDRFSQMFDLTFDLSAFDLFVAWERGACVCCPSPKEKLLPASYVADSRLTIWFSVPSTGVLLSRLRKLQPGIYPSLRLSLFCGEALPAELLRSWSRAAPNSRIENLYGPTELTIACTAYPWDPQRSPAECEQGLVPIGYPCPGMTALVVDESLREVAPGEAGELLMTGPQLSLGYWDDPERTAAAFVTPPGRDGVFYRTGDRVRRPRGPAPLVYLGRIDNQIKVQGYRVELEEVEAVLRESAGAEVAAAIGWPATASGADGIAAFLPAEAGDLEAIRERLKARLPPYMLPRDIHLLSEFPLNANGKVDRRALRGMLERSCTR